MSNIFISKITYRHDFTLRLKYSEYLVLELEYLDFILAIKLF